MLSPPIAVGIAIVAAFGALAIAGVETGRKWMVYVGKPAATLSLLLIVGLPPQHDFAWMIVWGIAFNLMGDVLLISDANLPFAIAVPLVLTGHIFYTAAFAGAASAGSAWWPPPWPAYVVAVLTLALVVLLWRGLGIMKIPVIFYAVAITMMVVAALRTVGGALPALAVQMAVAGAFLFYVSDSNLAWNRFKRSYPHATLVTLTTYWLGQIGIALSARLHG